MRYLSAWVRRLMLMAACVLCFVGCDQSQSDKFAGFASEQLSEQIEIVSAKLDLSIENNQQKQIEILSAVRDLTETVAGIQLTSSQQIEELKKVSGKAKAKLTATSDGKEGVATLDPNAAPSTTLTLDSLDDAARQIESLVKRIDELEKRCQCGKLNAASTAQSVAPTAANYPAVSSTVSYGSSGVSATGGGSTGFRTFAASSVSYGSTGTSANPVYSQVTYSQPVYSQPVYSSPVPMAPVSSPYSCVDQYGNPVPCNQNSQPATSTNERWYLGKNLGR